MPIGAKEVVARVKATLHPRAFLDFRGALQDLKRKKDRLRERGEYDKDGIAVARLTVELMERMDVLFGDETELLMLHQSYYPPAMLASRVSAADQDGASSEATTELDGLWARPTGDGMPRLCVLLLKKKWPEAWDELDRNPDAIWVRAPDGRTALHVAATLAEAGYGTLALMICSSSVDTAERRRAVVDARTPDGTTPAFIAAARGDARMLKTLSLAKADLTIPRNDCKTPRFIAAENGYTECVRAIDEHVLQNGGGPPRNCTVHHVCQEDARGLAHLSLQYCDALTRLERAETTEDCSEREFLVSENEHRRLAVFVKAAAANLGVSPKTFQSRSGLERLADGTEKYVRPKHTLTCIVQIVGSDFDETKYNTPAPAQIPFKKTKKDSKDGVYRAEWTFTAANDDELSFTKGQHLFVTHREKHKWWLAQGFSQGGVVEGFVPCTYLTRTGDATLQEYVKAHGCL